jgi:DNA-directed RNA polymerase subunit N (RpoN/RPB10)
MPHPVLCATCGRVINHLYPEFERLMQERYSNEPPQTRYDVTDPNIIEPDNDDIFLKVGLGKDSICCRKTLNTSVNADDEIIPPYTSRQ